MGNAKCFIIIFLPALSVVLGNWWLWSGAVGGVGSTVEERWVDKDCDNDV